MSPPRDEDAQGITRGSRGLNGTIQSVSRSIGRGWGPVTGSDEISMQLADKELVVFLDKVNTFFTGPWPEYKAFIEKSSLSFFKDEEFKPLEIK